MNIRMNKFLRRFRKEEKGSVYLIEFSGDIPELSLRPDFIKENRH